jgi:hypothetical protein
VEVMGEGDADGRVSIKALRDNHPIRQQQSWRQTLIRWLTDRKFLYQSFSIETAGEEQYIKIADLSNCP